MKVILNALLAFLLISCATSQESNVKSVENYSVNAAMGGISETTEGGINLRLTAFSGPDNSDGNSEAGQGEDDEEIDGNILQGFEVEYTVTITNQSSQTINISAIIGLVNVEEGAENYIITPFESIEFTIPANYWTKLKDIDNNEYVRITSESHTYIVSYFLD
jgi:hypothetical protein